MSFDYSRSNPSGKKTAPLATSAAAGHKGALAATGEPENSYLGTLILYISIICTSSLLILNVISTSVGLMLAWALHQDEIDRRVELDAEREKEHAISSVALVTSEPGDSRSYHSHIVVERDATPANYRIQEDIERSNGLKPQASSLKPQASSLKPQASSLKIGCWHRLRRIPFYPHDLRVTYPPEQRALAPCRQYIPPHRTADWSLLIHRPHTARSGFSPGFHTRCSG